MQVLAKGLPSGYDIEHLARVFYPAAAVRAGGGTRGPLVYARAGRRLVAGLRDATGACWVATAPRPTADAEVKLALSRLLYGVLCRCTGLVPPWGLLTGVRPVNLLRKQLAAGGAAAARHHLVQLCGVSEEKYALAADIEARQRPFLAASQPHWYSLYVGIPFCPTRCAYCSFVSRTIQREAHLMAPYVQALRRELAETARLADELGLHLASVYIGGGTPTALPALLLEELLAAVAQCFDTSATGEYTVEAGRPDCTDAQKLQLLREYGVTRLSINPQSMSDAVLQRIGRGHTAEDIRRCYAEARAAGHRCINMDLIAGLPGDAEATFADTLAQVLAMAPENVTLHSLTRKRASNLVIDRQPTATTPARMIDLAYPALAAAGYAPYYLYRQKSGVDNLENTGWARGATQGLYNIYIMEECHTILACGAGAATKLVNTQRGQIQRRYNHKLPADYITHIEDVLQRKRGVTQFYAGHLDSQTPG